MNISPEPFADVRNRAIDLLILTDQQGGSTVELSGRPVPRAGFVVSDPAWHPSLHLTASEQRNTHLATTLIAQWIQSCPRRGDGSPVYIGAWKDDDMSVYVDVNDILPDKAAAIRIGRERKQRAIYDLRADEEIRIWV